MKKNIENKANNTEKDWDKYWATEQTIKQEVKYVNTAYQDVIDLIKTIKAKKGHDLKCIEVGCGAGTYAIELTKQGIPCIASDFSESALNAVKIKAKNLYNMDIETKKANIYKLPYEENTFDIIFSDGVLEHLNIPKSLELLKKTLKNDGYIVAKVPSNSLLYLFVFYLLDLFRWHADEVRLSKKEWEDLLIKAGYKNIKIKYCGSVIVSFFRRTLKSKIMDRYFKNISRIYFLIEAKK